MFSHEAMEQFAKWAREKADAAVKNSFHPQDQESMEAKLLWHRVYQAEMQARTCGHQ